MFGAVCLQVVDEQLGRRIMRFTASGRVDMIDNRQMRLWSPYAKALCVEAREGLRAGVFVHDVEIDIDQHVAIGQIAHLMGVDQFVVERPVNSAVSAWIG